MKKEFAVKNKTPGGVQTIHFIVTDIAVDDLMTCVEEKHIRHLCQSGCINYGKKWSCPPSSPEISEIISSKGYRRVILICGFIELDDMFYIKNSYQKVKAANIILKSHCETRARHLENSLNGYSLLSGSCNLCKPCCKKRGLPCQKPAVMRYSLESTGINVELLAKKYCEHRLLWYQKNNDQKYTSVVTAVLVNSFHPIDYGIIFNA